MSTRFVVPVAVSVEVIVVLVTPLSVIVVRSVEVKDEFLVVIVGEIVEVDVVMLDIAACLVFEIKMVQINITNIFISHLPKR